MDQERRKSVDDAAFGVIYGTIVVLAILMVTKDPVDAPWRLVAYLFASVLSVALAKAFATVCEGMLATGKPAGSADFRLAWSKAKTILLAANGPTTVLILAATGVIPASIGLTGAQCLALLALVYYGARIGWRIRGTALAALVGASVTLAIGAVISALKYIAY